MPYGKKYLTGCWGDNAASVTLAWHVADPGSIPENPYGPPAPGVTLKIAGVAQKLKEVFGYFGGINVKGKKNTWQSFHSTTL